MKKISLLGNLLVISLFFTGCASLMSESKKQQLSFEYFIAGQTLLEERQLNAALEKFKKADTYQPNNPSILLAISKTNYQLGRMDAALSYLQAAIKLDPTNLEYLIKAGEYYLHQEKVTKAREMYEAALKIEPNNYEAHYGLGIIFYYLQDYPQAIMEFRKLISLDSQRIDAYLYLGNVFLTTKEYDEAIKVYQDAVLVENDNVNALYHLGMLYRLKNSPEKAENLFLQIAKNNPTFSPAYEMLADIYIGQKRWSDAETYYKKALELNPDAATVKNNLAWIYLEQNIKLDEAIKLALESVKAMSNADNQDTLGWGYFLAGDYNNSQKYLDLAQETANKEKNSQTLSVIYYHLGRLAEKKGDSEKALRYLKKAVEFDPANQEAQNYLKIRTEKTLPK